MSTQLIGRLVPIEISCGDSGGCPVGRCRRRVGVTRPSFVWERIGDQRYRTKCSVALDEMCTSL